MHALPFELVDAVPVPIRRVIQRRQQLIQLATDESLEPLVNKKAIEALGALADARAVPALMRMLTRERRGISFYAESSFSLFQVGPPAADALLSALEAGAGELEVTVVRFHRK